MRKRKKRFGLFLLLLMAVLVVPAVSGAGGMSEARAAENDKKDGLVKEKGYYRYYKDGKLQKKAWLEIKGKKYYFQSNGNAAVGSCKIGGKYYIFNAKGQLYTPASPKVVTVKGKRYQVSSEGRAVKGWSKDKKYYSDKTGKVFSGIRVIKGKFYSFGSKGAYSASKTKKLRKAAKYEKNMASLYKLIGKPKKAQYAKGCYGPGKDGILKYKNFTVYTYKAPNGKEIFMGAE